MESQVDLQRNESGTKNEDLMPRDEIITEIDDLMENFSMEKNIFNTDYPNLKLPEERIVIVGKSGAGKSSLINMLTNIFEGRKYSDERAIAISQVVPMTQGKEKILINLESNIKIFSNLQSDKKDGKQSESQTQNASIYPFPSANCNIHLIDTPGVGDTRGFEQDKSNIHAVVEALKASEQFNALCLIFKATDQRIDPIIKYLVEQYQNIMTNECKDNIIVCFTYVTDPDRIDALAALTESGIMTEDTPYFCFENSCLFPASTYDYIKDKSKKVKTLRLQEEIWERNYENAQKMILTVAKMKSIPADNILDLYLKKDLAYSITNEKILHMKDLTLLKAEIDQKREDCKKTLNKIKSIIATPGEKRQAVIRERQKIVKVKKNIPKYTMCIKHDICHHNCGNSEMAEGQGDPSIRKCKIFWYWLFWTQDYCKVCGCHYSEHLHRDWIMIAKEEVEQYTDYITVPGVMTEAEKIKQINEFEAILVQEEKEQKRLEEEVSTIENEKLECFKIIQYFHSEIRSSSLNKTQSSLLSYLNFTKELEKENMKNGKIDEKEYQKRVSNIDKEIKTYNEIEQIAKGYSNHDEKIKQKAVGLLEEAKKIFAINMKNKKEYELKSLEKQTEQAQIKKKSFFQRAGALFGAGKS